MIGQEIRELLHNGSIGLVLLGAVYLIYKGEYKIALLPLAFIYIMASMYIRERFDLPALVEGGMVLTGLIFAIISVYISALK